MMGSPWWHRGKCAHNDSTKKSCYIVCHLNRHLVIFHYCFGAAKLAVSEGQMFFCSFISTFQLVQKFVKTAKTDDRYSSLPHAQNY